MSDTQRTLSALAALLANNSQGAISAQDVRDLVETLRPGHGVIYLAASDGTADTSVDQVTWKPIVGTWALKSGANRFAMSVSGQLKYIGAEARDCFVASTAEIDNGVGQQNGQMALSVNGSVITSTITNQTMGVAWHETVIVNGMLRLQPNDYVEVVLRNVSGGGADIAVDFAHVLAMDFPGMSEFSAEFSAAFDAPANWPSVDELKLIVDVDEGSTAFDTTLERQMASGIALVNDQVGSWDNLTDEPDNRLAGAALRAAYLLSLKETPTAIVRDQVFQTYMSGHHRRYAIA